MTSTYDCSTSCASLPFKVQYRNAGTSSRDEPHLISFLEGFGDGEKTRWPERTSDMILIKEDDSKHLFWRTAAADWIAREFELADTAGPWLLTELPDGYALFEHLTYPRSSGKSARNARRDRYIIGNEGKKIRSAKALGRHLVWMMRGSQNTCDCGCSNKSTYPTYTYELVPAGGDATDSSKRSNGASEGLLQDSQSSPAGGANIDSPGVRRTGRTTKKIKRDLFQEFDSEDEESMARYYEAVIEGSHEPNTTSERPRAGSAETTRKMNGQSSRSKGATRDRTSGASINRQKLSSEFMKSSLCTTSPKSECKIDDASLIPEKDWLVDIVAGTSAERFLSSSGSPRRAVISRNYGNGRIGELVWLSSPGKHSCPAVISKCHYEEGSGHPQSYTLKLFDAETSVGVETGKNDLCTPWLAGPPRFQHLDLKPEEDFLLNLTAAQSGALRRAAFYSSIQTLPRARVEREALLQTFQKSPRQEDHLSIPALHYGPEVICIGDYVRIDSSANIPGYPKRQAISPIAKQEQKSCLVVSPVMKVKQWYRNSENGQLMVRGQIWEMFEVCDRKLPINGKIDDDSATPPRAFPSHAWRPVTQQGEKIEVDLEHDCVAGRYYPLLVEDEALLEAVQRGEADFDVNFLRRMQLACLLLPTKANTTPCIRTTKALYDRSWVERFKIAFELDLQSS